MAQLPISIKIQRIQCRYRHAYFEMLELAAGEIDRHFDQADVNTIMEIEVLLQKIGKVIDSVIWTRILIKIA